MREEDRERTAIETEADPRHRDIHVDTRAEQFNLKGSLEILTTPLVKKPLVVPDKPLSGDKSCARSAMPA